MTDLGKRAAPGPDHEYRYNELRKWVLDYLSEVDNPVPDYNYRRTLRNHIRVLVGAPDEPKSRSA